MTKRKRPVDLATARRAIAKTRKRLEDISELMETIASLDTYDQRPLFRRRYELEWELKQLMEDEERLVDRALRTVDPVEMTITKS